MTAPDNRIPSPCVRNCCLNEADICLGCFRSLTEILRWSEADDQDRQLFLHLAAQRRTRMAKIYQQ